MCYNLIMKRYTISDLKKFAQMKGGDCLSDKYINSHTKYMWKDEHGNCWEAKWYSILNGRWSPFTSKERKIKALTKYTINDLRMHAESKGGKCLSTEYRGVNVKYEWEDKKGRQFSLSWNNALLGQWSKHEKRETLSKLKTKYTIEMLKEFAKKTWRVMSI